MHATTDIYVIEMRVGATIVVRFFVVNGWSTPTGAVIIRKFRGY